MLKPDLFQSYIDDLRTVSHLTQRLKATHTEQLEESPGKPPACMNMLQIQWLPPFFETSKKDVKCPLCAENHAVGDCKSKEYSCSNCMSHKDKHSIDINVNYAAWDQKSCVPSVTYDNTQSIVIASATYFQSVQVSNNTQSHLNRGVNHTSQTHADIFDAAKLLKNQELKRKERGFSDEITNKEADVVFVKWLDNKAVRLASNYVGKPEKDKKPQVSNTNWRSIGQVCTYVLIVLLSDRDEAVHQDEQDSRSEQFLDEDINNLFPKCRIDSMVDCMVDNTQDSNSGGSDPKDKFYNMKENFNKKMKQYRNKSDDVIKKPWTNATVEDAILFETESKSRLGSTDIPPTVLENIDSEDLKRFKDGYKEREIASDGEEDQVANLEHEMLDYKIVTERQKAHEGQKKATKNMIQTSGKKLKSVAVGDFVLLDVLKVDRDPLDCPNLIGKILKWKTMFTK
ncbi:hypothetical protein ILUMI_25129 [Ignelater luminosus]|uniref:Uncharacterized protein n=1 Tax=Ignelater luminosus TaxID=2038154 RepID=A0A8K0FZZ2_IGNLU|nr:hypothetical protein ILUMI_25129 [Ignelater luminosus]